MRQKTTNEILEEINKRFDIKTPMGKLIANTEIIISKLEMLIPGQTVSESGQTVSEPKKDLTKSQKKRKKKTNCQKTV
jgi:hypothetical protein